MIERTPIQTHLTIREENVHRWHVQTRHPSDKVLIMMIPSKASEITNVSGRRQVCIKGKMCKQLFPIFESTLEDCFDLVHSDLQDPALI